MSSEPTLTIKLAGRTYMLTPVDEPKPQHHFMFRIGMVVSEVTNDGYVHPYLISQVADSLAKLISLVDGNRFCDKVSALEFGWLKDDRRFGGREFKVIASSAEEYFASKK